jgi:hypothetical protein
MNCKVLRRSELSGEPGIRDIINSTTAVVFLGTPHRGSPGLASTADVVRRVAQAVLRFDTNEKILRSLGIDSPELELCRESFLTQWRKYNFRVKTFQEAMGIKGINLSLLNKKVCQCSLSFRIQITYTVYETRSFLIYHLHWMIPKSMLNLFKRITWK